MTVRNWLEELKMYRRYAAGLPGYLSEPWTLDGARAMVMRCESQREDNFLRLVEGGIFSHAGSPYLALLRNADCRFGDIQESVRRHGLEFTLLELRRAGVSVTFEEFKGRTPIVRHGLELPVSANDFDNPFSQAHYYGETGGSTGPGSRVPQDLDHLAVLAAYDVLGYDAHGVADFPCVIWRGVLPDSSGVSNVLRRARWRSRSAPYRDLWLSPSSPWNFRPSRVKFTLATLLTVAIGRAAGTRLPWPVGVPLTEAVDVARRVAAILEEAGACVVLTTASRGLRICLAAREAGLNLSGTVFRLGGEPMTEAKMRGIEAMGARVFTSYGFAELGRVALDCSRGREINDLHLCTGICAVIQDETPMEGSGIRLPAFHFTSVLPSSPKILLNAESDDFGTMDQCACGCPLGELGLHTRLRGIASYRKLTGEGTTLVGSEMIDILENVLPAKFGGSPLDYQLIEEEDENGLTRLTLAIDPSISIIDERAVTAAVFDSLRASSTMADCARAIWEQADTFRVRRQTPVWTGRGKLMSLHVQKRYGRAPDARDETAR